MPATIKLPASKMEPWKHKYQYSTMQPEYHKHEINKRKKIYGKLVDAWNGQHNLMDLHHIRKI
jgi:hypothetical protein